MAWPARALDAAATAARPCGRQAQARAIAAGRLRRQRAGAHLRAGTAAASPAQGAAGRAPRCGPSGPRGRAGRKASRREGDSQALLWLLYRMVLNQSRWLSRREGDSLPRGRAG